MKLSRWLIGAAGLAATLGGVWGWSRGRATTPVAAFYGLEGTDWPFDTMAPRDARLTHLPAFGGNLASLRKVRIAHRHHVFYGFNVENLHPRFRFDAASPGTNPLNGQPWGIQFPAWIFAKTESGTLLMPSELPTYRVLPPAGFVLEGFDGAVDFAGPSGRTVYNLWDTRLQPQYWTPATTELTHPAHLAAFCDPDGTVTLEWSSIGYAWIEGPWGDATVREAFSMFWDLEILSVEFVTE